MNTPLPDVCEPSQDEDPRWRLADPICTFVFALLVLLTSKNILRDIAHTLMERTPQHLDISNIIKEMSKVGWLLVIVVAASHVLALGLSCKLQDATPIS